MKVAEAVGRTLGHLGVRQVFGVVGSGNFHVTNALIAAGARFVATRHEVVDPLLGTVGVLPASARFSESSGTAEILVPSNAERSCRSSSC